MSSAGSPGLISRESSLDPLTLSLAEIESAREAAMIVLNSKSFEEALEIFTQGLKPVKMNIDKIIMKIDDHNEEDKMMHDPLMSTVEGERFSYPNFLERDTVTAPF